MKEQLESFKKGLMVIDAINIYDIRQSKIIYKEKAEDQFDFLLSMIKNKCLDTIEFL